MEHREVRKPIVYLKTKERRDVPHSGCNHTDRPWPLRHVKGWCCADKQS